MSKRLLRLRVLVVSFSILAGTSLPLAAQVDPELAASYFKEAETLCRREGGRMWGVSLCGPMVFADRATRTLATNQTAPDQDWPRMLGFANAAFKWGHLRWATFVWQMIPADNKRARTRLMMHELFHRVQFDLRLMTSQGQNDHLDTLDGRYWIQLEWRALARALESSHAERTAAVRDALAFRLTRRRVFPAAAENERVEEIREGLAQYTGTVVSTESPSDAIASVLDQLAKAPNQPTLVRTAAYTSGVAYGILLDAWSPGWTRKIQATDDLGQLLMNVTHIEPTQDVDAAASRYGGAKLRAAEKERDLMRKAKVAQLRSRFVEGAVLIVPKGRNASFMTTDATPIPGHGTVMSSYRVTAEWGSFEAARVLVSSDGKTLIVPAPTSVDGATLTGDGWTVNLTDGWIVQPAPRKGDLRIVRGERR